MLVVVGILTGSVGVVSHTNQRYGEAAGHIEYLPILDKEYVSRSPKVPEKWTLLVKVLGREMWILVSEADWRSVSSGDSYLAVIKNGYWGFHVIGTNAAKTRPKQCFQAESPASGTGMRVSL
ncbi:MAG: hypothetical protein LC775_02330 [Acidobacteria bacterium]|nr:hypothetical protein [Acidobacteriota bacterium]